MRARLSFLQGTNIVSVNMSVLFSIIDADLAITTVAFITARGLDIPSIKTVVNYDVARDIDTHTHRIGRTGRAGKRC